MIAIRIPMPVVSARRLPRWLLVLCAFTCAWGTSADASERGESSSPPETGVERTAAEMAGFLLELYDGDKTVGEMDFANFRIKLSDPKHPHFFR